MSAEPAYLYSEWDPCDDCNGSECHRCGGTGEVETRFFECPECGMACMGADMWCPDCDAEHDDLDEDHHYGSEGT